jgi:hypothetical protein
VPSFALVRARLSEWRDQLVAQLPTAPDREAKVALKKEIEEAIRCLDFCERAGIESSARVHVLPLLEGRGGFSEYRVMDDAETEDRSSWVEPEIDGDKRRLGPGDLLVEKGSPRRGRPARRDPGPAEGVM